MSLRHYSNSIIIQGRCKALIVSAHSLSCPGLLTPVFKMTNLLSWEYGSGQAKASSDRSNYSGSPRWYDRQEVSSPLLLYCVDHMTWIHLRRTDWWNGSNFIKLCTVPLTCFFLFVVLRCSALSFVSVIPWKIAQRKESGRVTRLGSWCIHAVVVVVVLIITHS